MFIGYPNSGCNIGTTKKYVKNILQRWSDWRNLITTLEQPTMCQENPVVPMRLFPQAVIDEVLRRVAGGECLQHILEGNAGFPSKQTWYRWIASDVELSAKYVASVQRQIASRKYSTK